MYFCYDKAPNMKHKNVPNIFSENSPNKTKGVLIAIKDTVAFKLITSTTDPEGRYLTCEVNNTTYSIVNIYAPNTGQMHFLCKLWKTVNKTKEDQTILCGEFNLAPDTSIDIKGSTPKKIDNPI